MSELAGVMPIKTAHHQSRRNQILDAASLCFIKHGFHGAAMTLIAAAAKMSVGQIYRYFASKEEIIAAIVARQLYEVAERFPTAAISRDEAKTALSVEAKVTIADVVDSQRSGLIIEIRAEAARNPAIAEIVRLADAVISEHVRALIVSGSSHAHDPAEVERRSKFLAIVIDGLIFHATVDPEIDQVLADELIDLVCNAVVFPETE